MPPSKFGAGYTYGGGPVQPSTPAPSYSQPVAPPVPPPPTPTPSIHYPTIAPVSAPEPTPPPAPVYTAPVIGHAPSASGGAAIAAGVLALLLGAYQVWQTISSFLMLSLFTVSTSSLGDFGQLKTIATISAFASLAATLALILGGILLLCRKTAGRGFIVAGCLIVIIVNVLTTGLYLQWWGNAFGDASDHLAISDLGSDAGALIVAVAINAAVPLLTMVLALLKSTKRWCQAKSAAVGYAPVTY